MASTLACSTLADAVGSNFHATARIATLPLSTRAGTLTVKIERIETTLYRIPLATPVEAASHGVMSEFDMVAVRLTDSGGGTGCGYTVLNAGHGDAIIPIVNNVFSATLLADEHGAHNTQLVDKIEATLTELADALREDGK